MKSDLLELLAANAAAGMPCVLATVVRTEPPTSAHPGDTAVVTADGRLHGWIGGSCSEPLVRREALRAIGDGLPRMVRIRPTASVVGETRDGPDLTVATTCPSGGALDIFIDPQVAPGLLVVIGDSPAAGMLVRLGAAMGMRTSALDADALAAGLPSPAAADTWVVVATMGHYDEAALEAALSLPGADVALVASERRAAAVLGNLAARGTVSAADVARVRAPAGAVRGGTQEEIALHALDEVVALRRQRLVHLARGETGALQGRTGGEHSAEPAFATDPVCGMVVDVAASTHHVDHAGTTYHFCCDGCARSFAAEPERWLHAATG
ncbi:MAG TPA: XdhC family protein [Candidatus Dormibacteraeota bacterium]|jgi:xanthine dehydrogenase accessory factor|nr:XdhC family protein [Candidatus Dormibacteraeota bacterium]